MIPKEIAKLADDWWTARKKRLVAKHKMDELEKLERALKSKLMDALKAASISSIGGKKVKAELKEKKRPAVGDWGKLYAHIKKTGDFDLLQKRLTDSAVEARWEDEIEIPGVYAMGVDELSYSEIKR